MNLGKGKVMCNIQVNKGDVIVEVEYIEDIDKFVYLGQILTKDHDQVKVMNRRIGQGHHAFRKLDNIIRYKHAPVILKRRAFNECILPIMTYGCKTW